MESAAMLFCPPLPPLRLPQDRAVVIGRHRSCDFPLRRSNVSRRHAEVRPEAGRYVLRDLGSTNGTFVNGERVESARILQPGDRIDISSCTVTFCHIQGDVDAPSPEPSDEKTMLFERPPTREAFSGELAELPPFALLQMLEMGQKTGLLYIEGEDAAGRIWLADGAPVHAETEKHSGTDAALEIVNASRGTFRFEPQVPSPERSIAASVTELLLEASRLLDEAG
jgi:pSer/pThr/pTyr-binding forkhead associated (FHA) protein